MNKIFRASYLKFFGSNSDDIELIVIADSREAVEDMIFFRYPEHSSELWVIEQIEREPRRIIVISHRDAIST